MPEGRTKAIGEGYINRKLAAGVSLVKDNLVVEIDGSGELILGTNTGTPYGIAARSSQNKLARVAGISQFDAAVSVPLIRSGIVDLPLGSTNVAIAIGDRIVVHADDDGTVDGAGAEDTTSAATLLNDQKLTVGFAEEVKAMDAGGTVRVALKLYKGDAP